MPSITGGDSSDRDYAPHMWVLGPSLSPAFPRESDWVFVGNNGNVYINRRGETYLDETRYHVGATALSEIVCDVTKSGAHQEEDIWFKYKPPGQTKHVPNEEMPEDVLEDALAQSLDRNIVSMDRQMLISGLVLLTRPTFDKQIQFPDAINYAKLFTGRQDEQAEEAAKTDAITDFLVELKGDLGIPIS